MEPNGSKIISSQKQNSNGAKACHSHLLVTVLSYFTNHYRLRLDRKKWH